MSTTRELNALPAVPAASFVLIWCSGYIAGPAGVRAIDPFTLLTLRFVLATLVTAALARALRGPLRIDRRVLGRLSLIGLMVNAVVFALMYLAFDRGMDATLASLLHALSPVLTAVLAGLVLGERLSRLQVFGFALGVAGVLIVLGPDVAEAGGPVGIAFGLLSLAGLSIGTLGQRWFDAPHHDGTSTPDRTDPLWAATVQFGVCIPPLLALALVFEAPDPVRDVGAGIAAVLWLAVVNSVAGLLLLGLLVRRGGAGASASLFFICPPVTAVMTWIAFGDTLDAREIAGIAVAVIGVAVATGRLGRTPVAR